VRQAVYGLGLSACVGDLRFFHLGRNRELEFPALANCRCEELALQLVKLLLEGASSKMKWKA